MRSALALPGPVQRRLAGPPIERDGRCLDPAVQLLVTMAQRCMPLAGDRTDPRHRRTVNRRLSGTVMPRARGVDAVDRIIPGPAGRLRVRVYRSVLAPAEPPAIVYLHGGGWVVGDLDTHDGSARMLARVTGAVVVSVDYRRAPEDPFPAAVQDAVAAFRWAHANPRELAVRPGAVAVMGDSAGGNLAAVVSQRTRDDGGPTPIAQGLVYPATDLAAASRSVELFADGFLLTRADLDWFARQYVPDPADRSQPDVSPLRAADVAGLPPTHVWTAGFDPLRDEGRAYADRLADAGVPTRYRCLDDQVHGFFGMGALPGGLARIAAVCREMGELVDAGDQRR